MRSLTLVALVAFTTISSVACSQASEDADPESTESGATQQDDHAALVKRCDTEHETASGDGDSTAAMIEAEGEWGDCLARANDRAVAKLETNLAEANSRLEGRAAIAIAAARAQGEAFCTELSKASSNFGGSLARVEAASCFATRERAIAAFMDAYAFFGVEQQEVPEHRDQHLACYAAFDRTSETALATAGMIQVASELGACIGRSADGLATPLATIEVDNDATAGPLPVATARAKKTIADTIASGAELCAVYNEAGDSGGGSLARVTTTHCQARWAANVYADLKTHIGASDRDPPPR